MFFSNLVSNYTNYHSLNKYNENVFLLHFTLNDFWYPGGLYKQY